MGPDVVDAQATRDLELAVVVRTVGLGVGGLYVEDANEDTLEHLRDVARQWHMSTAHHPRPCSQRQQKTSSVLVNADRRHAAAASLLV